MAGCDLAVPVDPDPTPKPSAPAPAAIAPVRPTSPESAALRAYFTQVQSAQLTQGLLRRDGGGPDTPFTAEMLTRNYLQIAFYNEYAGEGLAAGAAGFLRRWRKPVRIGLDFGASVPPSQRRGDASDVTAYAARLKRVTGHPVSVTSGPNFIVAFLSEDDRADRLPIIAERLGLNARDLARLQQLPREIYCLVVAFPEADDPSAYGSAIAIVRSENPDLLRLSCIHEEVAQGLGLANDSPTARPSIFNDDDEFALLTNHDELLLKMHYDSRLSLGMPLADAETVARQIAYEFLEGDV